MPPRDRRQKPRYHRRIGQPRVPKRGTMRSLLLAATCLILFATAVAWRPAEGLAVNCAAVRSSCVAACNNRETTQAGIQACSNRCSIQFCRDTVIECRPGDQRVCNDDFSSCNGGCDALAAIHPPPPSRIKRLAPAAAAGSSRSVSASAPATQARSTANRQIGLELCLERATSTA